MKEPMITVVVPVYNVAQYLEKCVKSIQGQTFKNIEILLVNDGSTDDSGQLCDRLAGQDARIRVIHKENGGLSDARNRGIREARGQYIGLVDSDDYIDADMYEMLYHNLIKEQAEVSACSMYSVYKNHTSVLCREGYEVLSGYEMLALSLAGKKIQASACPKLYKKELLLETPFTVGRQYEDALLLGELFSKVQKAVVDYRPKYYYVHHGGTITTAVYRRKNRDIVYAYKKNYDIVKEKCPQYLDLARYRLYWAYTRLFDRMLVSDNQAAREDKKEVKSFLRTHYPAIIKCKEIGCARKIAYTCLLFSEKLYKALSMHAMKKYQND